MTGAALEALRAPLAPLEGPAWVVGGGLRDVLLGRAVADLDVAVEGDPAREAGRLARAHGAGRFRLSREFGAWRVHGGTLPFSVDVMPLLGGALPDDLSRRDLTVNALALDAAPGGPARVVDMHGGLQDLSARRLRLVSDGALRDDPVRVVRVARLAAQLGFAVDPVTRDRARDAAPGLAGAPAERAMDELRRLLLLPGPAAALEGLDALGGLGALVPQLEEARGMDQSAYHHKDVLGHTLEVVQHCAAIAADPEPLFRSSAPRVAARLAEPLADGMTRGQVLLFTAVMHDMAKPATRRVTPEGRVTFWHHDRLGAEMADAWCRRMRTANRVREAVARGVRHHLALGFMVHRQPLSLAQIDRFLRLVAPDEVEAVVLSAADRLATDGPRTTPDQIRRHLVLAREVMAAHWRIADAGPLRPPLDGAALARLLGRPPGPWVADLLVATREAQLMGRVRTRAQAERLAREWDQRNR